MNDVRTLLINEQHLWQESDALRDFVACNHTGFFKILKKHKKTVDKLIPLLPPGTLTPTLATSFMSFVETQPFLRILHNENPMEDTLANQPALLRAYKDRLKADLSNTFKLARGALQNILPEGSLARVDMSGLAHELQALYDDTIASILSKVQTVRAFGDENTL